MLTSGLSPPEIAEVKVLIDGILASACADGQLVQVGERGAAAVSSRLDGVAVALRVRRRLHVDGGGRRRRIGLGGDRKRQRYGDRGDRGGHSNGSAGASLHVFRLLKFFERVVWSPTPKATPDES